jgi:Cu/Ag efflux pump CusA
VRAEVITLWPGHAAEEVERLITIPLENELNGIARVTVIRSDTLFGLSNIRVVFADGTDDYWARQQAQERINQAQIPADAKPSLGPLSSVIGEVYRYTLESKSMSLVELKSLQDWVLEREFRQVPGVADVVSWGGRHQAVRDHRGPRPASRLQPHPEAGHRRGLQRQLELGGRLHRPGRIPGDRARPRSHPVRS